MSKKESKNRIININVFITNTVNNVGVNNMKYINPKIKNIVFNAIKTNKEGVKNSVKSINNIIRRIKKCVLNVRIFYIKKANIKRKFEWSILKMKLSLVIINSHQFYIFYILIRYLLSKLNQKCNIF